MAFPIYKGKAIYLIGKQDSRQAATAGSEGCRTVETIHICTSEPSLDIEVVPDTIHQVARVRRATAVGVLISHGAQVVTLDLVTAIIGGRNVAWSGADLHDPRTAKHGPHFRLADGCAIDEAIDMGLTRWQVDGGHLESGQSIVAVFDGAFANNTIT